MKLFFVLSVIVTMSSSAFAVMEAPPSMSGHCAKDEGDANSPANLVGLTQLNAKAGTTSQRANDIALPQKQ